MLADRGKGAQILSGRWAFAKTGGAAPRRWIMAHPGVANGVAMAGFTIAAMVVPTLLLASNGVGAPAWALGLLLSLDGRR